ncbi:MAG: LCP family protein [Candidatus Limnocylindria bacterium]
MTRRDRSRSHARPTAEARRIREAARRDEELRSRGMDPDAYESAGLETGQVALVRRRRRPPLKVILLLAVLLLLTITVVGGILLWQRVVAFNDSVSTKAAASWDLMAELDGAERVNVVLYGYGGAEHRGGNYLADSIQILSIDPAAGTTTMIPIPRDFWVEGLPQMPNNGKINEAFAIGYASGGIEEASRFTSEVLSGVTGLEIRHWMAIDFAGFEAMVNAVGGVTIDNPRAFRFTWSDAKFQAGNFDGGRFLEGRIDLNGGRALTYARARYTSVPEESSDFARSVRQQRVLAALRGKLGDGGAGSIGPALAMMDALNGRMLTNLSAVDLYLLSSHLSPDRRIELKEGVVLEATSNTLGQYILVVIGRAGSSDYAPLHRYLEAELARPIPSPPPSPSATP